MEFAGSPPQHHRAKYEGVVLRVRYNRWIADPCIAPALFHLSLLPHSIHPLSPGQKQYHQNFLEPIFLSLNPCKLGKMIHPQLQRWGLNGCKPIRVPHHTDHHEEELKGNMTKFSQSECGAWRPPCDFWDKDRKKIKADLNIFRLKLLPVSCWNLSLCIKSTHGGR